MIDAATLALPAAAGFVGGAMNALAGGGTFATLPALLAIGLPANLANATSNVALLPGAATSAWTFRDELGPVGGVSLTVLAGVTFAAGLAGSALLVVTPTRTFDLLIPWLVLYAFVVLAFGRAGAAWLARRVTIGPRTLVAVQALLGVYGGYFGGGVGVDDDRDLRPACRPRSAQPVRAAHADVGGRQRRRRHRVRRRRAGRVGGVPADAGRRGGGRLGRRASRQAAAGFGDRAWTLLVTGRTTLVFFWRAYA